MTFCGQRVVQNAVEAVLETALDVANKLEAAMLAIGGNARSHSSFGAALGKSARWPVVQEGLDAFDAARKKALDVLDSHAGTSLLQYLLAMASLWNGDSQQSSSLQPSIQ